MKLEAYEISSEEIKVIYKFISDGPKGQIMKVVEYTEFDEEGIYNLSLADVHTGESVYFNDYTSISNNGDTKKILTTVISTLFAFTERFSEAKIHFAGNNAARTRLYRMVISNSFNWLSANFYVFGLHDNKWQGFKSKVQYEAFLFVRKKINL